MKPDASPTGLCQQALLAWVRRCLPPAQTSDESFSLAVAYSGGADSTALLLATQALWPGRVVALHVHHGLQAAADGFEQHVRDACDRRGLPLLVRHVQAAAAPGQSPEEAARTVRYATLADMAQECQAACVLLGQHADDQAETLMLALSRGAGLPGMAGMPERFERHGVVFGRPFLDLTSWQLREGLAEQGATFVDDPTNADPRYTRNRIRAVLLPAWAACFPGFQSRLARSARHAAQAQVLLDELAQIDLERTGVPPVIAQLQALSDERLANALRYWIRTQAGRSPSTAQLYELMAQIRDCRTRGHRISIKVCAGQVRREFDHLIYLYIK